MNVSQISILKSEGNYQEIVKIADGLDAQNINQVSILINIAESYEKIKLYDAAAKWYYRICDIEPEEEIYGALLNVYFANKRISEIKALLKDMEDKGYIGFYYYAAIYELKYIENEPLEERIIVLNELLKEQEAECYMMDLIEAYLEMGEMQKAIKICKKLSRLFQSGHVVERANGLVSVIGTNELTEYRKNYQWIHKSIFSLIQIDTLGVTAFDLGDNEFLSVETSIESQADKISQPQKTTLLDIFKNGKQEVSDEINNFPSCIEEVMEGCVGLIEVKEQLNKYYDLLQFQRARAKQGFPTAGIMYNHFIVYGNSGMGKTKTAGIISKFLYSLNVLDKDKLVVENYSSIVRGDKENISKTVRQIFSKAEGGTILIDNIHEFYHEDNTIGMDAIDIIDKALCESGDTIALIITGEPILLAKMLANKKKFKEKFVNEITLKGYTVEELLELAKINAKNNAYLIDKAANENIKVHLQKVMYQSNFEYIRYIEKMIKSAAVNMAKRVSQIGNANDTDLILMISEDFNAKTNDQESTEELLNQLDSLTGLSSVKEKVRKMINATIIAQKTEMRGINRKTDFGTLHLVFKGNAGTGKTTVARIIGKIYKNLGILQNGDVFVECTRRDLIGEYTGQTTKRVDAKVKEAMGGILFVDEAYSLCKADNDLYGQEAIDTLVADIENYRDNLMVIVAGYPAEMDRFLSKNQGLSSRLSSEIIFDDYTVDEMVSIFKGMIKGKGLVLEDNIEQEIYSLLEVNSKISDFGNARGVRNVVERIIENQNDRLISLEKENDIVSEEEYLIIRKKDLGVHKQFEKEEQTLDELLEELNSLTGLHAVKEKVQKMVDTVIVNQKLKEAGIENQGFGTLHLVFKGNAGTGKTTVARIIGKIYKQLGVLPRGDIFVEAGRNDLVAGYIGQTALKVKEKVKESLGGILFIDEAYSLCTNSTWDYFGKEAIDTLVADIENYRDNLMLIVAGYSEDMDRFLAENQGLSSRLSTELVFEDYTVDEMIQIFKGMLTGRSAKLSEEEGIELKVSQLLQRKSKKKDFGNARGVRNVVDKMVEKRNSRIAGLIRENRNLSPEDYCTITLEDLRNL